MVTTFSAPFTPVEAVLPALQERGFAALTPHSVAELCQEPLSAFNSLRPSWDDLPPDHYLRDGGHYRRRRHSCFTVNGTHIEQVPHRAHWQSMEHNALHGGIQRWFEPIHPGIVERSVWTRLLLAFGSLFSVLKPGPPWCVEAHQFRIDTSDGIGRPTPEGAHRDGVDFVAVFLVGRYTVKGGETRVFEAGSPNGQRFTLDIPWSALLLDDARMIHECTPIQPADGFGYRDTLVLTYRAWAFQSKD